MKNGLKYDEINTSYILVDIKTDQDILEKSPASSWFIAYLDHRVVFGRLEDKQLMYYKQEVQDVTLENIQKLRIFNKDEELFVWRTTLGGHKARFRKDGAGESRQGVVDARQVLFGTKANWLNDTYAKLVEDRGTEIILPLSDLNIKGSEIDAQNGRLCINTRSYIGTIAETGQATYEDVRFVEFVKYQEE